jgi:hypothetical protein
VGLVLREGARSGPRTFRATYLINGEHGDGALDYWPSRVWPATPTLTKLAQAWWQKRTKYQPHRVSGSKKMTLTTRKKFTCSARVLVIRSAWPV